MDIFKIVEIAGVVVGLFYLWFEYRASIWLWLTSIIMPAIYIFVCYGAGLYGDMGIQAYYLIAGIYGWVVWITRGTKEKPMPITHMPAKAILPLAGITVVVFATVAWILISFTNSDVPYVDSFTNALSIAAMWMLARKYLEQWLVWIVVDVVTVGLYIYKGLYPSAGLYVLYAVIAVAGYFKWRKMMNENNDKEQTDTAPAGE